MPEIIIFIEQQKLTDGSVAFNVRIGDIIIPAMSEEDANDLAGVISDAINDHATVDAGIVKS